jgi:aerobic-type carbon monoxide dehydrogenase small subunit (CoxS/CutS family)
MDWYCYTLENVVNSLDNRLPHPSHKKATMASYSLILNGQQRTVSADGDTFLLFILRDELGINSAKYGCGNETCGACRVLVDGELTCSCTRTLAETSGSRIITVEGLAKEDPSKEGLLKKDELHPLQKNFLDLNAGQCGYCLSGILISAYKLLETNTHPDRSEITMALKDNLCRCGAHNRIIAAIKATANQADE